MSEPFLGQISIFSFSFPPKNWALCNGQLLAINQNQALFSLLGIQYGGNGTTTFALPNFQSRVPMGMGNGAGLTPRLIGQAGGEQSHTLTPNEMPQHSHTPNYTGTANSLTPGGNLWLPIPTATSRSPPAAMRRWRSKPWMPMGTSPARSAPSTRRVEASRITIWLHTWCSLSVSRFREYSPAAIDDPDQRSSCLSDGQANRFSHRGGRGRTFPPALIRQHARRGNGGDGLERGAERRLPGHAVPVSDRALPEVL